MAYPRGLHLSYALAALLHFEPQKIGLWTGDSFRIIAVSLIEKITTFVKFVYLALAFSLVV